MNNAALRRLVFSCGLVISMSGCSTWSSTEQGAVAGGLVGAGTGAVVGEQLGSAGAGAAIGAGTGAVVGGAVGQSKLDAEERFQAQRETIARQRATIERQNREIQDLKRQQYYNERLRRYEVE